MGPDTRLITLQNGVDSVERIAPILGGEQVAGGSAYIATVIGRARCDRPYQPVRETALRPHRRPGRWRTRDVSRMPQDKAGIDIETAKDMNRVRWEKFTFLVAMSGTTAATRQR